MDWFNQFIGISVVLPLFLSLSLFLLLLFRWFSRGAHANRSRRSISIVFSIIIIFVDNNIYMQKRLTSSSILLGSDRILRYLSNDLSTLFYLFDYDMTIGRNYPWMEK